MMHPLIHAYINLGGKGLTEKKLIADGWNNNKHCYSKIDGIKDGVLSQTDTDPISPSRELLSLTPVEST